MADIGFYCMGLFVGALVSFIVVKIDDWSKPIAILTGVIGAVFSGSLTIFLGNLQDIIQRPEAIILYPIGLANALVWVFAHNTQAPSDDRRSWRTVYLSVTMILTLLIIILLIEDPVQAVLRDWGFLPARAS